MVYFAYSFLQTYSKRKPLCRVGVSREDDARIKMQTNKTLEKRYIVIKQPTKCAESFECEIELLYLKILKTKWWLAVWFVRMQCWGARWRWRRLGDCETGEPRRIEWRRQANGLLDEMDDNKLTVSCSLQSIAQSTASMTNRGVVRRVHVDTLYIVQNCLL